MCTRIECAAAGEWRENVSVVRRDDKIASRTRAVSRYSTTQAVMREPTGSRALRQRRDDCIVIRGFAARIQLQCAIVLTQSTLTLSAVFMKLVRRFRRRESFRCGNESEAGWSTVSCACSLTRAVSSALSGILEHSWPCSVESLEGPHGTWGSDRSSQCIFHV